MTADLHELTGGFDDPLFLGSTSASEQEKAGYAVAIDGRGYLIDWKSQQPFTRRSVNLLNTQQAQSGGDLAQVPPEIWRRAAESWHQGEGQDRSDREDSLPFRFRSSVGVDVWTPWQISLLHRTTNAQSLAAGATTMFSVNGTVVTIKGTTGYWYDGTTVSTTTFAASVVAAASDGTTLYVLETDGKVYAYTGPSTSSAFVSVAIPSFDATRATLAVVKGFLLVGNKNVLYNATSGTATAIYTHPNLNWTWGQAADGDAVGYILGGTGDRWHVMGLALSSDATTLDPPTLATTLPDGEIPKALASYLGFVLIGSTKGFRLAAAGSGGALTYGRLVTTDGAVECFEGQDRFVWFGISGTIGGLGRADLSTFTSDLTPAVARDLDSGVSGRVGGVATLGGAAGLGRRVFSVDGSGIWVEHPTELVATGNLQFGAYTFGATDPKQGTYLQAFHASPGGMLSLSVRYDSEPFQVIGTAISGSSVGNIPIVESFSTIECEVRLDRDVDPTQGPILNRVEVRALVVPGRTSEWTIPVLVRDAIEYEGAVENRDVIDDQDHLLGLVNQRRPFIFREGTRSWSLYATAYLWVPQSESEGLRTHQGTFILVAREVA